MGPNQDCLNLPSWTWLEIVLAKKKRKTMWNASTIVNTFCWPNKWPKIINVMTPLKYGGKTWRWKVAPQHCAPTTHARTGAGGKVFLHHHECTYVSWSLCYAMLFYAMLCYAKACFDGNYDTMETSFASAPTSTKAQVKETFNALAWSATSCTTTAPPRHARAAPRRAARGGEDH